MLTCDDIVPDVNNDHIDFHNDELKTQDDIISDVSNDVHNLSSISTVISSRSHKLDMSNNNLTIMVWNIQGLCAELKDQDFITHVSTYDIIIFLETMKLDSYVPDTGNW